MKPASFALPTVLLLGVGLIFAARRWKRPLTATLDEELRQQMIQTQIVARGVKNSRVLSSLSKIPRHFFVPNVSLEEAYSDRPLAIGHGQTISQPYIVALMAELLDPQPTDKILEIGTGSGYQTAVLSQLVREIFSIEIVPELARRAKFLFQELGIHNINTKIDDGYKGWFEKAPFNGIVVTAAPEQIPQPLLNQLAPGGHFVVPVGPANEQQLLIFKKTREGFDSRSIIPVRFVPMTGQVQKT